MKKCSGNTNSTNLKSPSTTNRLHLAKNKYRILRHFTNYRPLQSITRDSPKIPLIETPIWLEEGTGSLFVQASHTFRQTKFLFLSVFEEKWYNSSEEWPFLGRKFEGRLTELDWFDGLRNGHRETRWCVVPSQAISNVFVYKFKFEYWNSCWGGTPNPVD